MSAAEDRTPLPDRRCDACGQHRPSQAVSSYLGPVSWGLCRDCRDYGYEPLAMIRVAVRMWHRTIRTADEVRVPQLARRLLKILHAPTYVEGSPTKAYLVELEDELVESGPRTPVGVTVDCLRRYDSGGLTKEQVIGQVEPAVRRWWANVGS